mmetsp:Transcript_40544/g.134168  ORF Transcript_40544/g.134168 Transcript_40544/m.134168 type:complete len:254 (-) Transcript_40544:46-807(-)
MARRLGRRALVERAQPPLPHLGEVHVVAMHLIGGPKRPPQRRLQRDRLPLRHLKVAPSRHSCSHCSDLPSSYSAVHSDVALRHCCRLLDPFERLLRQHVVGVESNESEPLAPPLVEEHSLRPVRCRGSARKDVEPGGEPGLQACSRVRYDPSMSKKASWKTGGLRALCMELCGRIHRRQNDLRQPPNSLAHARVAMRAPELDLDDEAPTSRRLGGRGRGRARAEAVVGWGGGGGGCSSSRYRHASSWYRTLGA